ncbi:MAG: hypothetical protein F6J95_023830 [Leptolyngbya sp. SIO1E4]|nr:hypothetical protein [Leptolyngbya sp. SIO1E4]
MNYKYTGILLFIITGLSACSFTHAVSPEIQKTRAEQQASPLSDGICSDGTNRSLDKVHGRCPEGIFMEQIHEAPKGLMSPTDKPTPDYSAP